MGPTIRLATVNIASGRDVDGEVRTSRLATAVAALGADVVALQEVDLLLPRSASVDQSAAVAEACADGGPAWDHRFAAALHGSPGPGARSRPAAGTVTGVPSYGVALMSRLPVRRWSELRLAPARGRRPLPLPPGTRPPVWLVPDEQRVALAAQIATPTGLLTVVTVHLSFAPVRAAVQLRQLRRWAADLPRPLVLMGDLNLPGSLPARLTRWEPLVRAPTFPSAAPRLQLDHVLADGLRRGGTGHSVVVGGSDHRGLVVEIPLE